LTRETAAAAFTLCTRTRCFGGRRLTRVFPGDEAEQDGCPGVSESLGGMPERFRFSRRAQSVDILGVECPEGGFNGGTEPRYAIPDALSEQRNPDAGAQEQLGPANGRRTARMQFAI
jgi:hypothetical protein